MQHSWKTDPELKKRHQSINNMFLIWKYVFELNITREKIFVQKTFGWLEQEVPWTPFQQENKLNWNGDNYKNQNTTIWGFSYFFQSLYILFLFSETTHILIGGSNGTVIRLVEKYDINGKMVDTLNNLLTARCYLHFRL